MAETDWPVACPSSVALSEPNISLSTAGQQSWVHDIENILTELPEKRGLGVVYWEPGWVGSSSLGSPCSVSAIWLIALFIHSIKGTPGCPPRGRKRRCSVFCKSFLRTALLERVYLCPPIDNISVECKDVVIAKLSNYQLRCGW